MSGVAHINELGKILHDLEEHYKRGQLKALVVSIVLEEDKQDPVVVSAWTKETSFLQRLGMAVTLKADMLYEAEHESDLS